VPASVIQWSMYLQWAFEVQWPLYCQPSAVHAASLPLGQGNTVAAVPAVGLCSTVASLLPALGSPVTAVLPVGTCITVRRSCQPPAGLFARSAGFRDTEVRRRA
jgi:hypothetical protein